MRICVDWGNEKKKVSSESKSIYEYLGEDEEFMASLRDDIDRILEMDDDEVRRVLDTLAEIVGYIEEDYGEIDAEMLRIEPGYASLYKIV